MTSQESVQSWTDNAEPSELVSTYVEDLLTDDDYQKGDKICLFCHEMVMRSRWLKRGTVVGWEGSHRVVDNTHKIVIERLECGCSINNMRDAFLNIIAGSATSLEKLFPVVPIERGRLRSCGSVIRDILPKRDSFHC